MDQYAIHYYPDYKGDHNPCQKWLANIVNVPVNINVTGRNGAQTCRKQCSGVRIEYLGSIIRIVHLVKDHRSKNETSGIDKW